MAASSNLFLCVLLLMVASHQGLCTADIILSPLTAGGRETAIVLLPAPQMLPSQYLPVAKNAQTASSPQLRLWVAVPNLLSATPTQEDIGASVERVLQEMVSKGFKRSEPFFLAAHSQVTASNLQDYAASTSALNSTGLILLGSFLKRSYRTAPPYPVPTLTIGGGLDGVCRVTRIMEEFVIRVQFARNRAEAIKRSPVTVVPGMSHLQFASGKPSDAIQQHDLKPEIEDTQAHQSVSMIAARFMEATLGNTSSLEALESHVQRTSEFLQPLIDAYLLEGSYQFKPPCNEKPPDSSCWIGCGWTERVMPIMAELKDIKINDTDSFHLASEIYPAIHHPKITSHCSSPNDSCVVSLSSVSQNIYYRDKEDSGLVSNSACEIRAKLKSRQSVMLAAGMKNVDFNVSDAGSRCKKINQFALDWALNRSDEDARNRFNKFGVPVVMGEDVGCYHNGGLWIYLPMKYSQTQTSDASTLKVSSIQLKTDVTYPIGMFQGMHFCKLLSPAKAMEWIYVDGLRAGYSLSGNRAQLMNCGL